MAVAKSAEAFRTISEAAGELDVPQHVLRHWEEAFGQIRPMRRAGGRRYYRPVDLDVLRGVRVLLYDQRYTTKGVQKIFKDNGVKYVAEIGRRTAEGKPVELHPQLEENAEANSPSTDHVTSDVPPTDGHLKLDDPMSAAGQPLAMPTQGVPIEQLTGLLDRLERVQSSLDETLLALEAIEANAESH